MKKISLLCKVLQFADSKGGKVGKYLVTPFLKRGDRNLDLRLSGGTIFHTTVVLATKLLVTSHLGNAFRKKMEPFKSILVFYFHIHYYIQKTDFKRIIYRHEIQILTDESSNIFSFSKVLLI